MIKSVELRAGGIFTVASFDAFFSLCHIGQFFFRITRFNFLSLHKSIQPFFQFFWIALFVKHLLQMFLSAMLFMGVRDIHSPSLLKSLVITCQFWCGISTIFILSSLFDGIFLSVATINFEMSDNIFQIVVVLKNEVSIEVILHIIEIGFRLLGLCSIHSFINHFLCYDIIDTSTLMSN